MRWFCYSSVLLVLYMIMVSGSLRFGRGWHPIMMIPLAIAVAMRERELGGAIFGASCGLVIDLACSRLFGFSGIWLLPGCLTASLLVSHLIKVNLLNFLWINAAVCTIMALTDYFFNYVIWNADGGSFVFTDFIIPAHLSAIFLSPGIYFAIKGISGKFSLHEEINLSSQHENKDEEYKIKKS
jgi:hypothetical protein